MTCNAARRVIMPKFTAALIDDSLLELNSANRLLEPLLSAGDLLTVQRSSQAMLKISRAINYLKEVPRTYKSERETNQ